MVIKIKKRKKSKRQRGNTTYGHGARKKWKKSGHRGGCGMAGTGKRGDQKTTLITAKYGNKYFGKQGITSRGTAKKKYKEINIREIQDNLDSLMKKFGKNNQLVIGEFKVLGDGDLKKPVIITAKAFTTSAKEKIEKAGGKAILAKTSEKISLHEETKKVSKEKKPEEKKLKVEKK